MEKPTVIPGQRIRILETLSSENAWTIGEQAIVVSLDSGDIRVRLAPDFVMPPGAKLRANPYGNWFYVRSWEVVSEDGNMAGTTEEHWNDLKIIREELEKVWNDQSFCGASRRNIERIGGMLTTKGWEKPTLPQEVGVIIEAVVEGLPEEETPTVTLIRRYSNRDTSRPWDDVHTPDRWFRSDEIISWKIMKLVEADA